MGSCFVHRLEASDTILDGFTAVEDAQDGMHPLLGDRDRQQRGEAVPLGDPPRPSAALFHEHRLPASRPDGQVLETVDRTIVAGAAGAPITAGAETGPEMGAFSSLLAPIKERGLLIKYDEYMPLGLTPVVVHVT